MITRENLIHEIALSIVDELMNKPEGKIDATVLATRALDTVMDQVAQPLCSVLENASPFGQIAADQIRKIAGK